MNRAVLIWGVVIAVPLVLLLLRRGRQLRSPRELATDELGTLTYDGFGWRCQPGDTPVPFVLNSRRSGPDARMLQVAGRTIARLSELEVSARRYVDGLSLPELALVKLRAVSLDRLNKEWVLREVAPSNKAAADTMLSGEPSVTLEFEIVGARDVLDVTFVDEVPVASDAH